MSFEMTETRSRAGPLRLAASSGHTSSTISIYTLRMIDRWPLREIGVLFAVGDRSYGALPSARIRQTVVSLPWVWPHVPCQTLGAIRDHYGFLFNMHISDASLSADVLVSYRRPVDCM